MNAAVTLTQRQLSDFLLNVAVARPVFIWGPPGIGKSALVQRFAAEVGLPCVSLLGSQLAPEDLIGVPQVEGGVSRFCPPSMIARAEPYCLFLDELNACSHEVQKAFYSLIHERRIGEYHLPPGSIIIGAGNRAQDSAIVKQVRGRYRLAAILKSDAGWPRAPEDRDVLYFLSQSFRARLVKELPAERAALGADQQALAHRAKALLKELAAISLEMAQMVVARGGQDWG